MSTTKKSTRIGVWAIAILLVLTTLTAFAAPVIGILFPQTNSNTVAQNDYYKKQSEKQASTQQAQTDAQMAMIKNYKSFTDLVTPGEFDPDAITELKVTELKAGTGDKIAATDAVNANYTGWNANGNIFDTTKKTDDEPTPIEFPLSGVIKGWTQGLTDQKVGGIYLLEIPSDLAYGGNAGDSLTAGPLKFVVEIVSKK